ncbi:hypothetical protein B0T24DRAFT_204486 [Lasiosphaeria ovina]|uniref:Uncharacterized protein n=1 Tax=Lasiosphaeria ovina TaxID=92902 RepID=A0AAE0NA26_9PEZI|nr:hypothetical protein B0T24DRAFT_204486 [Lasiosphaeria ovina]
MFKNRPPHSTPPCWPFYMSCHIWAAAAHAATIASMASCLFWPGVGGVLFFVFSFSCLLPMGGYRRPHTTTHNFCTTLFVYPLRSHDTFNYIFFFHSFHALPLIRSTSPGWLCLAYFCRLPFSSCTFIQLCLGSLLDSESGCGLADRCPPRMGILDGRLSKKSPTYTILYSVSSVAFIQTCPATCLLFIAFTQTCPAMCLPFVSFT